MNRYLAGTLLVAVLLMNFLAVCTAEEEEKEELKLGVPFKVSLDTGSYYWCYVPKCYEEGKTGAYLILHGAGGSAENMLNSFIRSGFGNWFEKSNCIGVSAKSVGASWMSNSPVPMNCLNDAFKTYKIDKKRVHIMGYSAGGFMTSWLGYDKPELFKTIIIAAAFLAQANRGAVKKHIQKPIYFVCGENDPNATGAKTDYAGLLKMGARFARIRLVPGQGHNFPFSKEFPLLFKWFMAADSGFDYPSALDNAKKHLKRKLDKALAIVKEIEKHPKEDGFWKELAEIKEAINGKGEKKLKSLISYNKRKPDKCIEKLKEFEKRFEGYPVADKAKQKRKEMEEALKSREE